MEAMRQRRVEAGVIAYSAATSACEKGTLPERALDLLEETRKKRL